LPNFAYGELQIAAGTVASSSHRMSDRPQNDNGTFVTFIFSGLAACRQRSVQ